MPRLNVNSRRLGPGTGLLVNIDRTRDTTCSGSVKQGLEIHNPFEIRGGSPPLEEILGSRGWKFGKITHENTIFPSF